MNLFFPCLSLSSFSKDGFNSTINQVDVVIDLDRR